MPTDPAQTSALTELIKSGVIGTFLVLTIIGSMTGAIMWGPSVKLLLAALAERLTDVVKQRDEAVIGWRGSTTAVERLTAALEARNTLERDRRSPETR